MFLIFFNNQEVLGSQEVTAIVAFGMCAIQLNTLVCYQLAKKRLK
jgi:hypothetical protein